jgi:uncharacterized membrane protein YdcZ (DUF606 family)
MDLEKYKKAWENQADENIPITKVDIYKMAHSKSSSIVKWIFIIGLLEFAFMISSIFIFDTSSQDKVMEDMGVKNIAQISQYLTIPIILYFLYMFYNNYKNISVTDGTKKLVTTIIKTRRTVRNYVIFNLLSIVFISSIMTFGMVTDMKGEFGKVPDWMIIVSMIGVTLVILLVFWLFYQLLYGILLRKLNRNYKELAKLEGIK